MIKPGLTNHTWVCQTQKGLRSKGFFFGDNPLAFPTPILYVQLSLSALLNSFLQFLLNPLGQTAFISQMLVGILLGPSVLGGGNAFADTIFPRNSFYISQTFALFGVMLFMFLVGVKMDINLVRQSGRKAVVIGLSVFFVPLILNVGFAFILQRTVTMEPSLHKSIIIIAVFQCLSSFHVIACLLADLKLLNSEIGRLAVSSSMVSGCLSTVWVSLAFTIRQTSFGNKEINLPFIWLSMFSILILIIYIMRPIMLWMVSQTTKLGKPIKNSYIFSVFIMVMVCALLGEIVGQHFMLGPMILGLAVPDGPPLGSALVEKLDSYISLVLLPSFFVFSGARINFSLIKMKTVGILELLTMTSFCGKLIGTVVPSLYCKMPAIDAFSLGLIMSAQGILDVLSLQHGLLLLLIDEESYSIMVLSAFILTAIITPLVKYLYNPSKRYMSTKRRRTIEHALPNAELRMLACIHQEESTPSIVNLLEVSNPTPKTPICFYVVHLMRLSGRSAPILIAHRPGKKSASASTQSNDSDRIVNAFRLYEGHSIGGLIMNAFTAISPYATMHDDVCTLALEKRVSMILIPFHKQFNAVGGVEVLANNQVRSVNRNILRNAPCSVGILFDRGTLSTNMTMSCKNWYSIGMIFVEGPDDREALAFAMRMAEHTNVSLTVTRLVDNRKSSVHKEIDSELTSKCKITLAGRKQHVYKEERVKDSVDMINVIRSIQNVFDLILVGRRHDTDSPLFMGLTEWNEFPELGFIGDMLASSDYNCEVSVLVVQQQMLGRDQQLLAGDNSFKSSVRGSLSVRVDMPRDDRVHPLRF